MSNFYSKVKSFFSLFKIKTKSFYAKSRILFIDFWNKLDDSENPAFKAKMKLFLSAINLVSIGLFFPMLFLYFKMSIRKGFVWSVYDWGFLLKGYFLLVKLFPITALLGVVLCYFFLGKNQLKKALISAVAFYGLLLLAIIWLLLIRIFEGSTIFNAVSFF